ncbi:MAG TPA: hypothetical protein ENG74_02620, partial [Thermoplasmatales archaeon]|nr:hypothetical protein [Thermoplasmatales archaeon]
MDGGEPLNVYFFRRNGTLSDFGLNYFYIKYIPESFTFSCRLGKSGWVDIDTYNHSIEEMGWCDDPSEPHQRLYFSKLPSVGRLNWTIQFSKRNPNRISIYTNVKGLSFNGYLIGKNGGVCEFSAHSYDIIDFSMRWDLMRGIFSIDRSRTDLDLYLKMQNCSHVEVLELSAALHIGNDSDFGVDASGVADGEVNDGIEIKGGGKLEISKFYVVLKDILRGTNILWKKFSFDIEAVKFELEKNRTRSGSVVITPSLPRIYEFITGERSAIESIYLSVSISSGVHFSMGLCNVDIESEEVNLPTVQINHPACGDVLSGVVEISGTSHKGEIDRNIELVQVRIGKKDGKSIDYSEWFNATGTTSWRYSLDTRLFSDGEYVIEARAFDGKYYSTPDSINVSIDNLLISITNPENGSTVSGTVVIQGIAESPNTIENVQVRIYPDGNIPADGWFNATGTDSWSYRWNTTEYGNGNYTIEARFIDSKNHTDSTAIHVTVDNGEEYNRPFIRIDHPGLKVASGNVTIDGIATRGCSYRPVQLVQIQIVPALKSYIFSSNQSWINVSYSEGEWSYIWDTSGITVGLYKINARCFDGKYYSDIASVTVAIDNRDKINITRPPLLNNSFVVEISRGKDTSVDIFNFDFKLHQEYLDRSHTYFYLSFKRFSWNATEKSSGFIVAYNRTDHSLLISRSKNGAKLEFENIALQHLSVGRENSNKNGSKYYIPTSFSVLSTAPASTNVIVRVDRLIFGCLHAENGELLIRFDTDGVNGSNFSVSCSIKLSYDVELHGIYVRIGDWSWSKSDFHLTGPINFNLDLEATSSNMEDLSWEIAQDWSWGWIKIGGNGNLAVNLDTQMERHGKFLFYISGTFFFRNGRDTLTISWQTINGKKIFMIDGSASAGIRCARLVVGEIIDIYLPDLSGNFTAETTTYRVGEELKVDGRLLLHLNTNAAGTFDTDIQLGRINNLDLGIKVSGSLTARLSGSIFTSPSIELTWNESGLRYLKIVGKNTPQPNVYLYGYAGVRGFVFSMGGLSTLKNAYLKHAGVILNSLDIEGTLYIDATGNITVFNFTRQGISTEDITGELGGNVVINLEGLMILAPSFSFGIGSFYVSVNGLLDIEADTGLFYSSGNVVVKISSLYFSTWMADGGFSDLSVSFDGSISLSLLSGGGEVEGSGHFTVVGTGLSASLDGYAFSLSVGYFHIGGSGTLSGSLTSSSFGGRVSGLVVTVSGLYAYGGASGKNSKKSGALYLGLLSVGGDISGSASFSLSEGGISADGYLVIDTVAINGFEIEGRIGVYGGLSIAGVVTGSGYAGGFEIDVGQGYIMLYNGVTLRGNRSAIIWPLNVRFSGRLYVHFKATGDNRSLIANGDFTMSRGPVEIDYISPDGAVSKYYIDKSLSLQGDLEIRWKGLARSIEAPEDIYIKASLSFNRGVKISYYEKVLLDVEGGASLSLEIDAHFPTSTSVRIDKLSFSLSRYREVS